MHDDDHDDRGERVGSALGGIDPTRELSELLGELGALMKNPDVTEALSKRGVNASLALVALEGLGAYLVGDKAQAADDLRTVAEEIEARLQFGVTPPEA
jgi:hypothetical protein